MSRPPEEDARDPTRRYHGGDLNSREAFQSLSPEIRQAQKEAVFGEILAAGSRGVTVEEIEDALEGKHQSIGARVTELLRDDRIHRLPKEQRRRTRAGRWAWIHVMGSGPAHMRTRRSPVEQLQRWQRLGRNILRGITQGHLIGAHVEHVRVAIERELLVNDPPVA